MTRAAAISLSSNTLRDEIVGAIGKLPDRRGDKFPIFSAVPLKKLNQATIINVETG